MFFQGIVTFLIVMGFGWLIWKKVITPFLKSFDIEVDDEPEVKTEYTERLKEAKKELETQTASVNAIRKEKEIKYSLNEINQEIQQTDEEIKNTSSETD